METGYTVFQKVLEVISIAILIIFILYIVGIWGSLPDKIPGHYSASGIVDRWGSKYELLFLPIVAVVMYTGLTAIEFFPKTWNVPDSKREENKISVYAIMKTMLIGIKIEILVTFFFISYHQAAGKNLPPLFVFGFPGAILGTVIFFALKSYKAANR